VIAVTRESEPGFLQEKSAESGRRLCEAHKRHHAGSRKTRPEADSSVYRHTDVFTALERSFQKRCAYCESTLPGKLDVEHFRPESIYPLLAYRWNNLLLSCNFCNSHYKGAQFPLLPGGTEPDPDPANPEVLDGSDSPMLIDPCSDDPSVHFDWLGEALLCKTERAEKTRVVCGLDRMDLEQERRKQLRKIDDVLMGIDIAWLIPDSEQMRHYKRRLLEFIGELPPVETEHPEPYTAMARAYLSVKLPEISDDLAAEFEQWEAASDEDFARHSDL
jgi:uncharacterized protein (TIGR02646 family)